MKIACFKQSTLHYKNAQRGASLLEAVAYLGIASLVLVGAVSMVGGAFTSAETNRTAEEFVSMRTAAKKVFSGQIYPEVAGVMVGVLIDSKAVPSTLTVDSTNKTLTNGFGGAVAMVGTGLGGGNLFSVTYDKVPRAVCIGVISGASGWKKASYGESERDFPLTAAQAQEICNKEVGPLTLISS